MAQELDWQRIGRELARHLHDSRRGRADFAAAAGVTIRDLEALFAGQPVHHAVVARISKEAGRTFSAFQSALRGRDPSFEVPESDPPSQLRAGSFLMHRLSVAACDEIVSHLLLIRHDPQSRRTQFVSAELPSDGHGDAERNVQDGFVWHAVEAGTTQLVSEERGLLQVVTLARPQVRIVNADEKALVIKGTAHMMAKRGDVGFYPAIAPVLLQNVGLPRRKRLDLNAIDDVASLRQILEDPGSAAAELLGSLGEEHRQDGDVLEALHSLAPEVMPVLGPVRNAAPGGVRPGNGSAPPAV